MALNLISSKNRNAKLESIKKNLQFFFWLAIIGLVFALITVFDIV